MNIQEYIVDHWSHKMSADTPVLTIYDKDGLYKDIVELAKVNGFNIVDTTTNILHARLSASKIWRNILSKDNEERLIIYRRRSIPTTNNEWVEEPYAGFIKGGAIFPMGPQDEYINICKTFLPAKIKELDNLFANGNPTYNTVNALLDGANYPELEQFTKGKSFAEFTIGMLKANNDGGMPWKKEWQSFCEVQYPGLQSDFNKLSEVQSALWSYLLFSEFVFDLPQNLPDNLKSVPVAPIDMKEKIYIICDKIRGDYALRDFYVKEADKISNSLHLAEVFSKEKHLGDRVTFCFENNIEFNRFVDSIKRNKIEDAFALYDKNIKDVWYQENTEIKSFWRLAENVLLLINTINSGIPSDGSLRELVNWYAETGCNAETAFRKYHSIRLSSISMPHQEREMTEIFNNRYREFTDRGVQIYQQKANEIKDNTTLKNQGAVQFVYPALKEGKKVVFFMVDAFRYDIAKNFFSNLCARYHDKVNMEPRISTLPSVTRFGMAGHLDDIEVREIGDSLIPIVNGMNISIPDERVASLRKKTSIEVYDTMISEFDIANVPELARLLIIRSTGIDCAGENEKLNGLASMELEMNRLYKCLEDCRSKGFDQAIFVTDHGFMLQPNFRAGDQIEKPVGHTILEESRLLVGSLNDTSNVISFTPKQLGIKSDIQKFCYAKNFTVFKKGDIYYHEGLSLQENIVPIITVNLQKTDTRKGFDLKLRYKGNDSGTIYTRKPLIDIVIVYKDLFNTEDVDIKFTITDAIGTNVGKPDGHFYNSTTETLNIPSGVTTGRQAISIIDEYDGNVIIVTAYDVNTNLTLSKIQLSFEAN